MLYFLNVYICTDGLTSEVTCAGLAMDGTIKDYFAAQPRLLKSQD